MPKYTSVPLAFIMFSTETRRARRPWWIIPWWNLSSPSLARKCPFGWLSIICLTIIYRIIYNIYSSYTICITLYLYIHIGLHRLIYKVYNSYRTHHSCSFVSHPRGLRLASHHSWRKAPSRHCSQATVMSTSANLTYSIYEAAIWAICDNRKP